MDLERNLLRRMIEALIAKPNTMATFPHRAGISATIAQKKPLNALTRLSDVLAGDFSRPDEIAHRLVSAIRDPNLGQLARARQSGEHDRIAPISLNAIASTARRVCWGDDIAKMAGLYNLAMRTVSAGARLIDEVQLGVPTGQLLEQSRDRVSSVGDFSEKANLAAAFRLGNSNCDRRLVDIESDVSGAIHLVRLLCARIGALLARPRSDCTS
jgi:hypothetical protein